MAKRVVKRNEINKDEEKKYLERVKELFLDGYDAVEHIYVEAVKNTKTTKTTFVVRTISGTFEVFYPENVHEELEEIGVKYGEKVFKDNKLQPVAIYLCDEVWVRQMEKGQEPPKERLQDEKGNPKEGVEERLIVSGMTFDKENTKLTMFNILRDKKGNVTDLKKEDEAHTNVQAGILDLFYYGVAKSIKKHFKVED